MQVSDFRKAQEKAVERLAYAIHASQKGMTQRADEEHLARIRGMADIAADSLHIGMTGFGVEQAVRAAVDQHGSDLRRMSATVSRTHASEVRGRFVWNVVRQVLGGKPVARDAIDAVLP